LLANGAGRGYAQASLRDSAIRMGLLEVSYAGGLPAGELEARFGYTPQLGLLLGVKMRSNFYLQTGFRLLLGSQVKERNMLDGLSNSLGLLIADDGTLTDVMFLQRGWGVPLMVGKIFPLSRHHPNSGFYVEVGAQFLQHRIHFRTIGSPVAAISGPYRKGYDRLTNGPGIRQGLGFRFFDPKGFFNFSIGLEFSQHFTQNRRSINIDTGLADTHQRLDLLNGFSASWVFPLYRRAPDKRYVN